MLTYEFLQHYWCFLVCLLAGLLVFLMFVQGANSLIFRLGRTEEERQLVINSTGRKWEYTFTTLVTFGGAFFASFPLFYSTSFGGAYWVWMLILASFVLQAVAYEYQGKPGNTLGRNTYRWFLVINGFVGPFLVGAAVATFYTGAAFFVEKANIAGIDATAGPVISRWANNWHGLDALFNPWNWVLGFAVFFLARVLGSLYLINNIADDLFRQRLRRQIITDCVPFLIFFVAFVGFLMLTAGYAVDEAGTISVVQYKYFFNLIEQPAVCALFLVGVVLVLFGIAKTLFCKGYTRGIWPAGIGTVLTVVGLLLLAAWNGTAYYPSSVDPQSSLTLQNSCSSEFTLRTMAWVSLIIPFVLAYIFFAWRAIDKKKITREELQEDDHKY